MADSCHGPGQPRLSSGHPLPICIGAHHLSILALITCLNWHPLSICMGTHHLSELAPIAHLYGYPLPSVLPPVAASSRVSTGHQEERARPSTNYLARMVSEAFPASQACAW